MNFCKHKGPGLSWGDTISQLASRESSQHSVDGRVGTLGRRPAAARCTLGPASSW